MKAAVIHGLGIVKCDNIDDPKLKDASDVILKVTVTAICGSDLHIYSVRVYPCSFIHFL